MKQSWLDWVHLHIRAPRRDQAGDILLEKDRGHIPLEDRRFRKLAFSHEERKIAVIDGGSAPLLSSSSLAVFQLKAYGAIFQGKNCSHQHTEETTAILRMQEAKVEILIQNREKPAYFEKKNLEGTDILTTAANQVRLAMELTTARALLEQLEEDDIILLDGSLVGMSDYESLMYHALFEHAQKKGVLVFGLAKTTNLLCQGGTSAITALRLIEPYNTRWLYRGLAKQPSTHFVKLHPRSKYVFRLDSLKYREIDLICALECLVQHCLDPAFLGYPYPLIKAHQRGKIHRQDVLMKKQLLKQRLGSRADLNEEASSAHDVLDEIMPR